MNFFFKIFLNSPTPKDTQRNIFSSLYINYFPHFFSSLPLSALSFALPSSPSVASATQHPQQNLPKYQPSSTASNRVISLLNLILNQVVEGNDGANKTAQVHNHEFIVGLDCECLIKAGTVALFSIRR